MMDYEIFREVVKETFLSHMPTEYQEMEKAVVSVEKVNRTMDGISLQRTDGESAIFPVIYINDMYADYMMTGNLQLVMENAAASMVAAINQSEGLPPIGIQPEESKIIFQLVNTLQNEEMLKNRPHREFNDLSIIYQLVVGVDEEGIMSVAVDNAMANSMGMDESQLFSAAAENTRHLLPPVVKTMNEVMREIFEKSGMPPEMVDMALGSSTPIQAMWVITNERGVDGAASMLYNDLLHGLAENVGGDLYIIPSSVHEVIAVSTDAGEPEELAEMVADVNMEQLELKDRLSNQVYHYDKGLREITLATDTPNKRLDGAAAGKAPAHEPYQAKRHF